MNQKFLIVFSVILLLGVGTVVANSNVVDFLSLKNLKLQSNGGVPVNVIDQHSQILMVYFNNIQGNTTLSEIFEIDSYNITLNNITGVQVGDYVGVFDDENLKYYVGTILNIIGNDVIMDTPSDFNYTIGDRFEHGNNNMNVDGSVEPVIFSVRATNALNFEIDITRLIIHITDQTTMDNSKFGGINALERGVVLRRVDGINQNIFNIKTNGEMGELAFDKVYDDRAPSGFFGVSTRLTFAGQNKMGVTIRLGDNDDLQLVIQDDLTGLDTFRIMAQGHVVED